MPIATHRLRVRRVKTVGFVDKGDDPDAEIVFFKRAETFDEVGSSERISEEVWDLTHRLSRSIRSALDDSEDNQSPLDIITTSLDQFMATVRARAPMWVQGKPVEKRIIQRGQKFIVMSEDDAVLGTHDTKEEAETQLRAVEANKDTNKRGFVMDRIMKALRALGLRSDVPKDEIVKLLADGAPGSDDNKGTATGGDMPFDIEKLGDEERAEFEKLQGQLAEATTKIETLEKGDGDGDEIDTEGLPEPVAKALADLAKRTEEAEKRAEAAEANVEKLVDASERDRFIAKAKSLGLVPDDDAVMLRKIAGALDDEEFAAFEKKILSLSKQAAEGGLYGEVGVSGQISGDEAEAEVIELTKKYREENPGTSEELARGNVMKNRIDLRRALEAKQNSHGRED